MGRAPAPRALRAEAPAPQPGWPSSGGVSLIPSSRFISSSVAGLRLERVTMAGAGTFAVQLEAAGSARFTNVVATQLGAGGTYDCNSGFTLTKAGTCSS